MELESPMTALDLHKSQMISSSKDTITLWRDFEPVHSIRCASTVQSVLFNSDGSDVLSAHGDERFEMKLWQLDQVENRKFWFTKVREFPHIHTDNYTKLVLSMSGEHICALSRDETISLWKLFRKKSEIRSRINDLR